MNKALPTILIILLATACSKPVNDPPVAVATVNPRIGDTLMVFLLDGRNSTDRETPYYSLQYRWDADADGTWDSEFSQRTNFATRFHHPGYCRFILQVADEEGATATFTDSVFILSQNPDTSFIIDPRDGQRYRTVRIDDMWWMAENLRYGISAAHNAVLKPNNGAEFLYFNDDPAQAGRGSLYTWMEANYYPSRDPYQDVCPPGWRIPGSDDWADLFKTYPQPFDVLYYFGNHSLHNLGVEMSGYYQYGNPDHPLEGQFLDDRASVRYWTSDYFGRDSTRSFTAIRLDRDSVMMVNSPLFSKWIRHPILDYIIGFRAPEACYVRCVKRQ